MNNEPNDERLETIREAVAKVQDTEPELNFDLEFKKIEKELNGWN